MSYATGLRSFPWGLHTLCGVPPTAGSTRTTVNSEYGEERTMCLYCTINEGWSALLQYDDVYQEAMGGTSESTYGFHESYDDIREQVDP